MPAAPAKQSGQSSVPSTIATGPVNVDTHREDMDRRRAEQLKKRPKLLRCLDPTYAAAVEGKKAVYEWEIHVKLWRQARGKKRAGFESFTEKVLAQTESDAWAVFCDTIGEWPSRRDANPTITRLERQSFEEASEGDE